jgi:trehalose 6-phosphate phosphatase
MATISALPHALTSVDRLRARIGDRVPALFLDYDGVLTPIVDDPAAATLDPAMRDAVVAAADALPVAVISGRDLDDVRGMIDVPGIAYAGSHGFDMLLADGERERKGDEYLDDLDAAQRALDERIGDLPGVTVERKRYAIAVHTRRARDADVRARVERTVEEVAADHDRLRVTGGKMIQELRPAIEWDKGRALVRLMEVLELDTDRHPPLYVGDDITDEDAFHAIAGSGMGIVVAGEEDRPTAAALRLDHPDETADLLRLLADHARGATS